MTIDIQKEIAMTLENFENLLQNSSLLKPLQDLLKIETAVVGGAIRDSILNKPIKDIDIYLHLNYFHNLKIDYPRKPRGSVADDIFEDQILEASHLEQKEYQIINLINNNDIYSFLKPKIQQFNINNSSNNLKVTANHMLIWIIEEVISLSHNYNMEVSYKMDEIMPINNDKRVKEIAYSSNGLNAVLCIKDEKSLYPLEILITTDYLKTFLDKFDFNICKVAMIKKDNSYTIDTCPEFLEDVKNKTITYQPYGAINEKGIEKSLSIRYPRLASKYGDYTLICNSKWITADNNIKELVEQKTKIISNYIKLSKLEHNDTKSQIKLSKI